MKIVGTVSDLRADERYAHDPVNGLPPPSHGEIYTILKCPACAKVNIVFYYWHDLMDEDDSISYDTIFPADKDTPIGLPDNILKAFKAAEKVRSIDINAYVILLRRLLEMVCLDRKAEGDTLALMLKDLASKNEIPNKLVNVAKGLKDFGNIGAHASIGELSEEEVPIVAALSSAILEYIYSAPHLAAIAEEKLKAIKSKKA